MRIFLVSFVGCAIVCVSEGIRTNMDFGNDEYTSVVTNSTSTDDTDVEVKHTIVVSTKFNNNNKKGFRNSGDPHTFNAGQQRSIGDNSGEVPVINGYKSVDTTAIRTPDSRQKGKIYPDAIFVSRNIRDEYDHVYPNVAANPAQWKPSNFFNNINYMTNNGRQFNGGNNNLPHQNPQLHRKITDDGMREFYCKKCAEYSGRVYRDCATIQQRSANPWQYETTTPKLKIDGKLAKLN